MLEDSNLIILLTSRERRDIIEINAFQSIIILHSCFMEFVWFIRWLKQEKEAEKVTQSLDQTPKLNLGFKEGQTIKLNLGVSYLYHIFLTVLLFYRNMYKIFFFNV